jgi:hypothetical protein
MNEFSVCVDNAPEFRDIPFTFRGNKVIQPELPIDFLESKVYSIVVELCLGNTRCGDGCRQSRNICFSITPTTALLASCISCTKGGS